MAAMASARDGSRNGRMGKCKEDGKSDVTAGSTGASTILNILQRSDAATAAGEVSSAYRPQSPPYTWDWRRGQEA